MKSSVGADPRVDPRIRGAYGQLDTFEAPQVASRDEALRLVATGRFAFARPTVPAEYYEAVAPSDELDISTRRIVSAPGGNAIDALVIRPEAPGPHPCVYYLHGGGMAFCSAFDANYQAWGRMLARHGVVVVMPEFRNSLIANSNPDVAPFPAGRDDCIAGLRWLHANATELDIDPARVVIAGESGGANLSVATALCLKQQGETGLIAGIYALCPYFAPGIDGPLRPAEVENRGILSHGGRSNLMAMAYGIEQAEQRNPLAWPAFATPADLAGLPPTMVSVAECDSLRDEGLDFYRTLLAAGVMTRCIQLMGMVHAIEVDTLTCPDISMEAAGRIASFAWLPG